MPQLVRTDVFDMTTKDAAGAEQAGEFYLAFVGSVPGRDRADCPVGAVSVEHLDAESPASGRARSTTAVPAAADAEEGAASDRAGTLLSEFFDHIEKTKGEVQAEFEKMDQDQDGFLSEQEVLEGFTNAGLDVSPGPPSLFRVSVCAARTLNATGPSRVTLSLRQGHLRAACGATPGGKKT